MNEKVDHVRLTDTKNCVGGLIRHTVSRKPRAGRSVVAPVPAAAVSVVAQLMTEAESETSDGRSQDT